MLRIQCQCGKSLKVGDNLVGKKIKCPACALVQLVKAPGELPDVVKAVEQVEAPARQHAVDDSRPNAAHINKSDTRASDENEAQRPRKKKQKKKGNRTLLWVLVGGGAAAVLLLIIVVVGAVLIFLPGMHKAAQRLAQDGGAKTQKWHSDGALSVRLENEVKVQTYALRPPKAYLELRKLGAQQGGKFFGWESALRRGDGAQSLLMVAIYTAPEGTPIPTLEQAHATQLKSIQDRRRDWSASAVERGEINGLLFARSYWSGTEIAKGVKMRGFLYVTIDGPNVIGLSSQEVDPFRDESLKVTEAAAMTFRQVAKK